VKILSNPAGYTAKKKTRRKRNGGYQGLLFVVEGGDCCCMNECYNIVVAVKVATAVV
jgi:hypothetical protein